MPPREKPTSTANFTAHLGAYRNAPGTWHARLAIGADLARLLSGW